MKKKLVYRDGNEVLLGDRINFRSIFGKNRLATVCYMPDLTARELQVKKKSPEDWLIVFDDGTYTGWIYSPEDLQPNKRISLVNRGSRDFRGLSKEELKKIELSG